LSGDEIRECKYIVRCLRQNKRQGEMRFPGVLSNRPKVYTFFFSKMRQLFAFTDWVTNLGLYM